MPEPSIPQQVKTEVKKEISKKDLSWIRKDWIVVGVLFVVLSVLSITSTYNSNASRKAADTATAIIKGQNVTREYLSELMRHTGVCTLLTSGAVNTEEIPYESKAIDDFYNQCLLDHTGTPPPPTKE